LRGAIGRAGFLAATRPPSLEKALKEKTVICAEMRLANEHCRKTAPDRNGAHGRDGPFAETDR